MSTKSKHQHVLRVYAQVRGEKKFRLPDRERSAGIRNKYRDVIDNNPGRTPQAPNPDKL